MSEKKTYLPNRKPRKTLEFTCMQPQLIPTEKIIANDWNPNEVAREEMELLAISIEENGFAMACIVVYDAEIDRYILSDGFHRYTLLKEFFKSEVIPCVVLDKTVAEQMRATIHFNRAKGKHKVDMMAKLVARMLTLGQSDSDIAKFLGMQAEEVLRLKRENGLAAMFAGQSYGRAWVRLDDKDMPERETSDEMLLLAEDELSEAEDEI